MKTLPDKELLRPDEVAKYFSVALSTIYTWIETGKLEAQKIAGKTIRIKRETIINAQKSTLI
jgi:excisionase family DNA binding protein